MFMDLSALKAKHSKGNDHSTHTHVVVPLLGRFKEENGTRCLEFPLPLTSMSGLKPAPLIYRVLTLHKRKRRTNG